jgi:hypothetical protein
MMPSSKDVQPAEWAERPDGRRRPCSEAKAADAAARHLRA